MTGATGSGRKGGILRDGVVGVGGRMNVACPGGGGSASRGGGLGTLRDGVAGTGGEGGSGNGCVGGGGAGRMPMCLKGGFGDERTGVPGACEADAEECGVMGEGV